MDTLPTEVLSHVFAMMIPVRDSYKDHYVAETTNKLHAELSLVCRYWEQVVIKTPEIWSYIHLSRETTEQTLRRRLGLSGREPLYVRVDVGDDADVDDSKTFPALYDILLETVDRWRSFVFQGTLLDNDGPKRWIPQLLPNVEEAAYYGLIEHDNEGLEQFDHNEGVSKEYRFKPWTVAPKLKRFAVETSGQFYFKECPLVTEFAVSDIAQWWGGSLDAHSWHDKWEEYLTQLAKLCPQLKTLEISGLLEDDGLDPMGWTTRESKWPQFPHLHTLKVDAVHAPSTIPIISKFNAPNLRALHLGHIHTCLPLPLPSVTLGIEPSSCQIHFDNSPLHAIKLFLQNVSQLSELNVSIAFDDAFGMTLERYRFTDERGEDPFGERARIIEDWTWFEKHTRSVQWILSREISEIFSLLGEPTAESASALALMWKSRQLGL